MSARADGPERDEGSAGAVYRPPVETPARTTGALSPAELRTAAYVFGGWLFGTSVLAALVESVGAGMALAHFGGESWLVRLIVVAAFRQYGASVAASAGVAAIATLQHRRRKAEVALPRTRDYWPILAMIPAGAIPSACLITLTSVLYANAIYGVTAAASWSGLTSYVLWTDIPFGLGIAAAISCGIAVIARLAKRLAATTRRGLFVRIVVGLLFLKAGVGAVNFTTTLIWTGNDDSRPLIDYPRGDVSPD